MKRRTLAATLLLGGVLFGGTGFLPLGLPAGRPRDAGTAAVRTDLYGDPLPPGALARLGTVRLKEGGRLTCFAFSPDGKRVASASDGQWLRTWDTAGGRQLHAFPWEGSDLATMVRLEFSPDGKRLAFSGHMDSLVHLWDAASGRELRSFGEDDSPKAGFGPPFAFNPDGKTLVWEQGGVLRLSDVDSGAPLWSRPSGYGGMTFAPDGKTLAVLGNPVTVIDAANGKDLVHLPPGDGEFRSLAFSTDGRTLVTTTDGDIRLWDAAEGKVRARVPTPFRAFWYAFSFGGKMAAAAIRDGRCQVLDLASGMVAHRFPVVEPTWEGPQSATNITFSPDGMTAAWAVWGGNRIHLTEVASGKELLPPSEDDPWADCFAFTPDGKALAAPALDGHLRLWDAATGKLMRRFEGPDGRAHFLGFPSDGKALVCVGDGVTAWDVATGKEVRRYDKVPGAYDQAVALSPGGKVLAYGPTNVGKPAHMPSCKVTWWDLETGKKTESAGAHVGPIQSIAFSPDGQALASVGHDGGLHLWDASSGKERWQVQALKYSPACRVTFGAGGTTVVTAHLFFEGQRCATTVVVWDAAGGTELRRFKVPTASFLAAFSADGRRLALQGPDDTIEVWDVDAAQCRGQWLYSGGALMAALSPAGNRLATWGWDRNVLIWDGERPSLNAPEQHPHGSHR